MEVGLREWDFDVVVVEAPNEKILKYNKGMKFDCIVSNAPYDNGLHEKFESKYF